jgi:hypothetical protein
MWEAGQTVMKGQKRGCLVGRLVHNSAKFDLVKKAFKNPPILCLEGFSVLIKAKGVVNLGNRYKRLHVISEVH